jgi:hypothetical protein
MFCGLKIFVPLCFERPIDDTHRGINRILERPKNGIQHYSSCFPDLLFQILRSIALKHVILPLLKDRNKRECANGWASVRVGWMNEGWAWVNGERMNETYTVTHAITPTNTEIDRCDHFSLQLQLIMSRSTPTPPCQKVFSFLFKVWWCSVNFC